MDGSWITQYSFISPRWWFSICTCHPYRSRTKGKVERPISYMQRGFFYGKTFINDDNLNAKALS